MLYDGKPVGKQDFPYIIDRNIGQNSRHSAEGNLTISVNLQYIHLLPPDFHF